VPPLHTTFPKSIAIYCGKAGRLTFWHSAPANNTNTTVITSKRVIFLSVRVDENHFFCFELLLYEKAAEVSWLASSCLRYQTS